MVGRDPVGNNVERVSNVSARYISPSLRNDRLHWAVRRILPAFWNEPRQPCRRRVPTWGPDRRFACFADLLNVAPALGALLPQVWLGLM